MKWIKRFHCTSPRYLIKMNDVFLFHDKFSNISTNIKLRLEVSLNENTLAYYELREKSYIVQATLFYLKIYILLVYNMFLSVLLNY
jgi:hypothetical protein